MIKAAMLPWQTSGRKGLMANGSILVLLLLLIFYYISWNTLSYSSSLTHIDPVEPVEKAPPPPIPTPSCPPPPPPPSPYDPTKLAFLVETRPLPHLPALFAHMTSIIPPEWLFKFMGSPEAIESLRSSPIITRLEESGRLSIVDLPSNYSLENRETISQMFTSAHFYSLIAPAEHLLVFQPDSIFCANAPRTINDFLQWDWIGAPWSKTATYGGNGGLSLRKVSKIRQVLEKENRTNGDGALEDLWLAHRINGLEGSQMPNADISKTFSVESVWDDAPLGYHIGWLGVHHEQIWDDQGQVDHVMSYCPEVKMILGMKLDNDKPKSIP